MNSTMEALRYRVPIVALPRTPEQVGMGVAIQASGGVVRGVRAIEDYLRS